MHAARGAGKAATTGRPAGPPPDPELALLDDVLDARAVWPVLQPIVELETGAPAGYEALARGPHDGPLHTPGRLFAVARRAGRLAELDALCRERALEAALRADVRPPSVLFVNVEPEAVTLPAPAVPAAVPAAYEPLRARGVHVVAELTERALTADPARLLAYADRVRALGGGIALDDVGADPASLALMPLLSPEVVKLDLSLVQAQPDPVVARTMTAVTAYAEAHRAAIVAEGVETAEHESTARSLGATHGQGWRYGYPTAPGAGLGSRSELWRPIVPRSGAERSGAERPGRHSPYLRASRGRAPLQGTKRLLLEVSRLLERQAADMDGLAVVLATFEDARHLGRAARARYAELAARSALVGVIGAGLPPEPAPGVRGADLAPGDPLRSEWDLVVVGPHFAAALVARDRGDDGEDLDRRFDYVLTYDRAVVLEIARSLMSHIGPRPPH